MTAFTAFGSLSRASVAIRIVARIAVATAILFAAAAYSGSGSAQAWQCSTQSAVVCNEPTFSYARWGIVSASMVPDSSEICAKLITAAGNQRTAINGPCAYNANFKLSCFYTTSGYPTARAYVYWAGSGTTRTINGSQNLTFCN